MADETGLLRVEPNPKWIRGFVGGRKVVDSRRAVLVWENPYYPVWHFPIEDIDAELATNGDIEASDSGDITRYDLVVDGTTLSAAAWRYLDSTTAALQELAGVKWDALDSWFEEDVEVFVHPRSPNARIDALASSRHVRVSIDGTVVADSHRPTILYETGLPPRYYLPKSDVRMDLLTATDTETGCPYKGWANYWSITVDGVSHKNLAWGYRTPLPESAAVAGLVCFYNEKVDIEVDGIGVG